MQEFMYALLFGSLTTNALVFLALFGLLVHAVFRGTIKSIADAQTYELLSHGKDPITAEEVARLLREHASITSTPNTDAG